MGISNEDNCIFGLDIGTRSIVGIVGRKTDEKNFVVEAMCVREHETRAMLDGQIHDIYQVSRTVVAVKNELEKMTGYRLDKVCIAAAGRVLKTMTVTARIEYDTEHIVTDEDVYSLELKGVELAYIRLQEEIKSQDVRFYCVGYSAVKYYLNGYSITKLQGHRAIRIGVDLLATFLPEEVIEGLYSSVEGAGLTVVNLTLEPIAAINVAIPDRFRLLNIALVDVGAGTSDICITKDGSVTAYGMIPFAGDELTETLAREYLVDFNEAERIKVESSNEKFVTYTDIMGIETRVESEKIHRFLEEECHKIAKSIADKIIKLNGDRTVSAVFVVGGGGKFPGFIESLAQCLQLPASRAALRGGEVLQDVTFRQEGIIKDSLYVTPIGICLNYYENKNTFVQLKANGANIKIFDNNNLTIADVALQLGIKNEELFPMMGRGLKFTVNGVQRTVRGKAGEPAHISLNGREASITTPIRENDDVLIQISAKGIDAAMEIRQLKEYNEAVCPSVAVNGEYVTGSYKIRENDDIVIEEKRTVNPKKDICILVNGQDVELSGKEKYIFVDILDFYHFDTSRMGGKRLVLKVNGIDAHFTTPLKDGDETLIYWDN